MEQAYSTTRHVGGWRSTSSPREVLRWFAARAARAAGSADARARNTAIGGPKPRPHSAENAGLHGSTWHARGYALVRCDREACPLHPYRLGKIPARAGIGDRPRQ